MDTARSWTRQETIVLPRADAHARRERRRARQWLWHVVLRVEARGARLKGSDLNGSDLNEAPASLPEPEPFFSLGRRVERVERAASIIRGAVRKKGSAGAFLFFFLPPSVSFLFVAPEQCLCTLSCAALEISYVFWPSNNRHVSPFSRFSRPHGAVLVPGSPLGAIRSARSASLTVGSSSLIESPSQHCLKQRSSVRRA